MNIQYQSMTGFGAMAWNHGGPPLFVPATHHLHEQKTGKRAVLKSGEPASGKCSFPALHEGDSSLSIG